MQQEASERGVVDVHARDSGPPVDVGAALTAVVDRLEGIERRLAAIETGGGSTAAPTAPTGLASAAGSRGPAADPLASLRGPLEAALAAATDAFDEEVARGRAHGVDADARLGPLLGLAERLTRPETVAALSAMLEHAESLAPLVELAATAPHAIAAFTDIVDAEISQMAAHGQDVDAALRNGLAAVVYLGQRVSTAELEALGTLLRSDVLHPRAVDMVGRLGRALVEASEEPRGSVGPFGALRRLGDRDARRTSAFLLEFARRFGQVLEAPDPAPAGGEAPARGPGRTGPVTTTTTTTTTTASTSTTHGSHTS